jgi:hypothetical protein
MSPEAQDLVKKMIAVVGLGKETLTERTFVHPTSATAHFQVLVCTNAVSLAAELRVRGRGKILDSDYHGSGFVVGSEPSPLPEPNISQIERNLETDFRTRCR